MKSLRIAALARVSVAVSLTLFIAVLQSSKTTYAYQTSEVMSVPWAANSTWYWNGPHNWSDTELQPWNSLDFNGDGGSGEYPVLAAAGGVVHLDGCSRSGGYVRVSEPDGWSQTYYHLVSIPTTIYEGASVVRGQLLGYTGTNLACWGGQITGNANHVHFSIWYVSSGSFCLPAGYCPSQEVAWDGGTRATQVQIGNYVWTKGSAQYYGCETNVVTGARECFSGLLQNPILNDGGIAGFLTPSSAMGSMAVADSSTNEVFYAFMVRPSDGHLMLNLFNSGWTWWDENVWSTNPPSAALTGRVAQISFIDSAGVLRQFAFVRDVNGRLYVDFYGGNPVSWQWANQSQLSGAPSFVREVVGSGSFTDATGARQLYVFVIDNNGNLWTNYGPASSGLPSSWLNISGVATPQSSVVPLTAGVGAIAYATLSVRAIYAYGYDANGHLDLIFSGDGGGSWNWYDQNLAGSYPGVAVTGRIGVDALVNSSGVLCVYAFVIGTGGEVYVNYFDGSWKWNDQLMLSKSGKSATLGIGVTHLGADGSLGVYAAVLGSDSMLWLNYGGFTSNTTSWYQMPKVPGLTPDTDVGATSFIFPSTGAQALYFEAVGSTTWQSRDLLVDFWYSSPPQWIGHDQGSIG